jgi:uncharacterized protein (TIGR02996 family)
MATSEDELLAAIRAEPDSDAPRLVYADWLLEHGDVLGEHIELSIRLRTLAEDDPRRHAIHERIRAIAMHKRWWRELGSAWGEDRGMCSGLSLGERELDASLLPRLRRTVLRNLRIQFDGDVSARAIDALCAALPLTRLHQLTIDHGRVAPRLLAQILAVPALADLRELRVQTMTIGDDGARAIAEAALPRLARLELHGLGSVGDVGDHGAHAIANARLPSLRTLELPANRVGARGAHELLDGRLAIEELDLARNALTRAEIVALLGAPAVPRLLALGLAGLPLNAAVLDALATSPRLTHLRRLSLARADTPSGIDLRAIDRIARSPHLSSDLVLEIDGHALALRSEVFPDPAGALWVSEPPKALTARFTVRVVGSP